MSPVTPLVVAARRKYLVCFIRVATLALRMLVHDCMHVQGYWCEAVLQGCCFIHEHARMFLSMPSPAEDATSWFAYVHANPKGWRRQVARCVVEAARRGIEPTRTEAQRATPAPDACIGCGHALNRVVVRCAPAERVHGHRCTPMRCAECVGACV